MRSRESGEFLGLEIRISPCGFFSTAFGQSVLPGGFSLSEIFGDWCLFGSFRCVCVVGGAGEGYAIVSFFWGNVAMGWRGSRNERAGIT